MRPDPDGTTFDTPVPGGTIGAVRSGAGDVALLLHGGPALSDVLGELGDELRPAGVTTIRYQQRGLAPSTLEGPFGVERHVADAIAVLDTAGADRAWVVGHSWGGYLALQVATRHADRVRGVLAIGTLGGIGDGGGSTLGPNLLARVDAVTRAELEELDARETAGTATDDDLKRSLLLLWPAYFGDAATAPPFPDDLRGSIEAHTATMASVEPDADRLAAVLATSDVPAVFLHGTRDPIDLDASARATAEAMPRAEVIALAGVGHFPWLERPGCGADALRRLFVLAG